MKYTIGGRRVTKLTYKRKMGRFNRGLQRSGLARELASIMLQQLRQESRLRRILSPTLLTEEEIVTAQKLGCPEGFLDTLKNDEAYIEVLKTSPGSVWECSGT